MSNQPEPVTPREWKDDDYVGNVYGHGYMRESHDVHFSDLSPEVQALLRGQSEKDMTPAKVCPDCEGYGVLGYARDRRLISCETCGGHEGSIGTGTIKAIFVNSDKVEAERGDEKKVLGIDSNEECDTITITVG